MRLRTLLLTTTAILAVCPAFAGDIKPIVNVSTDLANDLRGLVFAAADGKIYASGHVGTVVGEYQTVVARFNGDGTPDAAFGKEGFTTLDLAPGRGEQSLGVAELADGDVVVAVNAVDEDKGQSVYLLRFDSAGAQKVAPAWGDDEGKVEVVFGWANSANADFTGAETPPMDTSWDLDVDATGGDEKLVINGLGSAAQGSNRTDNDRFIVRLNAADGSPDASFNGGVPVTYHTAGTLGDNARRAFVEADGAITSVGYSNLGEGLGNHVVMIHLLADGSFDPAFGNFVSPAEAAAAAGLAAQPGVAVFNPFHADGGVAEAYGAARLSDGTYVTTGYGEATEEGKDSTLGYASSGGPDVVSFHFTGTELDTTWAGNGALAIQSEGQARPTVEDRSRMVVGLGDDRTVHVGRYGGNAAIYVLTTDGRLDTSVDGDGIIEMGHPTNNAQFFNAAVSADGKLIAVTTNANDNGARLVVLEVQD